MQQSGFITRLHRCLDDRAVFPSLRRPTKGGAVPRGSPPLDLRNDLEYLSELRRTISAPVTKYRSETKAGLRLDCERIDISAATVDLDE